MGIAGPGAKPGQSRPRIRDVWMRDSESRSSPDERADDWRAGQPAAQGKQPGPRGDLGALLAQVARGDLAPFEAVYDGTGGRGFGPRRTGLRAPAPARAAAQEVLLEGWRAPSPLHLSPRAWPR